MKYKSSHGFVLKCSCTNIELDFGVLALRREENHLKLQLGCLVFSTTATNLLMVMLYDCVFDAHYCSVKLIYFQKLRFTTNCINKRIELEEDEYICK